MKALKVIGIIAGIIVVGLGITALVIIWNVDEVPDDIIKQYNEDSSTTTDSTEIQKMDDLFNDPEFDFDFGEDIDNSTGVEDTVMSV